MDTHSTPASLYRPMGSGGRTIVKTMDEARRRGLSWAEPQPEPKICEFCGRTLHHHGLVYGKKLLLWFSDAELCTCDKAIEQQRRYEAEWARLKNEEALERERNAKKQKNLDACGIKERFRRRTFEHFVRDTAGRQKSYDIAKAYADNFAAHAADGSGLYIEGTNGTGKTHLAAAIALQLINEQGASVICKTSSDMLLDIKKTFDGGAATEAQMLKAYKAVDLLIIDDLGKEFCSDWSMSTLYSILNDRYEAMRPTIITTNYNSVDLMRALTPSGRDNTKIMAILSRLCEVSNVVTMAWDDYRNGH